MTRKSLLGSVALLLTALIWGTAFVAQKTGLDYLSPCALTGIRSLIGAIVLVPVIFILDCGQGRVSLAGNNPGGVRTLLIGGLFCGLCLACASILQQVGIKYTTVGKSGFLTALYIIIVPLLGLFMGRRLNLLIWLSAILAITGMMLLCYKEGEAGLNKGDVCLFFCSIVFSLHILVIDKFAPSVDCVRMSALQFLVTGILSTILSFVFEDGFVWADICGAYKSLLYLGVMSSGVAYTLQIVGQKSVHPVVASLLMSLESVFAAIAGAVLLHESMTTREIIGCAVIFTGVILAQLRPIKN